MFVSLTMVKNEEDIIESFVRYHAAKLDSVFVFDDSSQDATWRILKALEDELPNVKALQTRQYGFWQSDKLTEFYQSVAPGIADDAIVFLLDADEFLDAKFEKRDWSGGALWGLRRVNYIAPVLGHHSPDRLFGMAHAFKNLGSPKVAFRHKASQVDGLRILDGSHNITLSGRQADKTDIETRLHHYQFRSVDHFMKKTAIGWLSVLQTGHQKTFTGKPTAIHWKRGFEHLVENDFDLSDEDFLRIAYKTDDLAALLASVSRRHGLASQPCVYDDLRDDTSLLGLVAREFQRALQQTETTSRAHKKSKTILKGLSARLRRNF